MIQIEKFQTEKNINRECLLVDTERRLHFLKAAQDIDYRHTKYNVAMKLDISYKYLPVIELRAEV